MNKILALLLAVCIGATLAACGSEEAPVENTQTTASQQTPVVEEPKEEVKKEEPKVVIDETKLKAVIETELGDIHVDLNPEEAPITVANFQKLVSEGFYDGLTFHRVIAGFMIQGGDPNGNGTGGADEDIKGEFKANGVENNLSHTRGVISMARSYDFNSASSQFFIMHEAAPDLDGQYAAFGTVTDGLDVVDAIVENSPVEDGNGTVKAENQLKINRIYFE